MRQVFDFYVDHNISFADALHASVTLSFKLKEIVSFDRGFDRVAGIRRIEP
jgi:predicted nucleic acid-binding protein